MTKLRAWLNSSTGHKVVVGCVLLYVWVSVTVAHRATHGDGFLPVLVLAAVAGVLSLTAAGALLAVARLVNGGAVVFLSGLMFLQGEYIAAEYDRSAVLESIGVVALLFVVGTRWPKQGWSARDNEQKRTLHVNLNDAIRSF